MVLSIQIDGRKGDVGGVGLANLGNGDRGEEGEKKWRSVEERPKNGALRYLIVLSLKQGGS